MPLGGSRRSFLRLLAIAPLVGATGGRLARAEDVASIARLIAEARALPAAGLAQRIEFISRSFLGVAYGANTLIGGPRRREQFVVRDDAFDCVTYCETVLAAALARDYAAFEAMLRTIRYTRGRVRWDERNHYFSQWSRRAVENGICRPVAMPETVTITKTLNWGNLGRRSVSMACVPQAALLANGARLSTGDVIGFVSQRPALDFFHTGFVVFGKDNELLLRSAAQSRRRVLDEPLAGFVAANGVRHVTLLRAVERPAATLGGWPGLAATV